MEIDLTMIKSESVTNGEYGHETISENENESSIGTFVDDSTLTCVRQGDLKLCITNIKTSLQHGQIHNDSTINSLTACKEEPLDEEFEDEVHSDEEHQTSVINFNRSQTKQTGLEGIRNGDGTEHHTSCVIGESLGDSNDKNEIIDSEMDTCNVESSDKLTRPKEVDFCSETQNVGHFSASNEANQTTTVGQEAQQKEIKILNSFSLKLTKVDSEIDIWNPNKKSSKKSLKRKLSTNKTKPKPKKNLKTDKKVKLDKQSKIGSTENKCADKKETDDKCTMCYKNIQCKDHTPKSTFDKRFQCDVCGSWFKHTYTLRKHKCNHEGKYVCTICNKRYGLPSYLKRHMRNHTEEQVRYPCRYCDKTLCSTSSLRAHERLHTLDKPFECDICHKKFTQSSNLATHKKIHTDVKPYVCELCSKPFRHKQSLLVHLRSHTNERPYSCATCGQTFTQNTHMRTHERLHAGIKPYKCQLCEKSFSRKHHLEYHLETHTGKTYKCSICEKAFTSDRAVIQHERIHTGDTPYKCDVCGKEFKYHGYLSVHKRIHTGDMPFKCKKCPKEFIVASSLLQHLKHNHKKNSRVGKAKAEFLSEGVELEVYQKPSDKNSTVNHDSETETKAIKGDKENRGKLKRKQGKALGINEKGKVKEKVLSDETKKSKRKKSKKHN